MHRTLLASAALLGLLAGGAYAQTAPAVAFPGTEPLSTHASNISPADTHSLIAPRLPTPAVGEDASPAQLLSVANDALQKGQTGLAQEALERAETRVLDRSTAPSAADQPDNSALIRDISSARQALGQGDLAGAQQPLQQAMAMVGSGSGMRS